MDEKDNIKVINLSTWEADTLNKNLQYLINQQLSKPEVFKQIPEENLKDLSWLMTWRTLTFK